MTDKELVKTAIEAKEKAYAPYSHFKVGAAIQTRDGKVYTGVNVENASFGATCCAERTAVFKAVTEGEREFDAIAIAGDSESFVYPCGICRQVLSEFGGRDLRVLCSDGKGDFRVHTLEQLLPEAFVKIPGENK